MNDDRKGGAATQTGGRAAARNAAGRLGCRSLDMVAGRATARQRRAAPAGPADSPSAVGATSATSARVAGELEAASQILCRASASPRLSPSDSTYGRHVDRHHLGIIPGEHLRAGKRLYRQARRRHW